MTTNGALNGTPLAYDPLGRPGDPGGPPADSGSPRRLQSYELFPRASGVGPETRDIRYVVIDRKQWPSGIYERLPKQFKIEDLNTYEEVFRIFGGGWYRFGSVGADHQFIDWTPGKGEWLFFDGPSIPYAQAMAGSTSVGAAAMGPVMGPAPAATLPAATPAAPAPTDNAAPPWLTAILTLTAQNQTQSTEIIKAALAGRGDSLAQLDQLASIIAKLGGGGAKQPDPLAQLDHLATVAAKLGGGPRDLVAELDRTLSLAERLNKGATPAAASGVDEAEKMMNGATKLLTSITDRDARRTEQQPPLKRDEPQGQEVFLQDLGTWATLNPTRPPPIVVAPALPAAAPSAAAAPPTVAATPAAPLQPHAAAPRAFDDLAAELIRDPAAVERLRIAIAVAAQNAAASAPSPPQPAAAAPAPAVPPPPLAPPLAEAAPPPERRHLATLLSRRLARVSTWRARRNATRRPARHAATAPATSPPTPSSTHVVPAPSAPAEPTRAPTMSPPTPSSAQAAPRPPAPAEPPTTAPAPSALAAALRPTEDAGAPGLRVCPPPDYLGPNPRDAPQATQGAQGQSPQAVRAILLPESLEMPDDEEGLLRLAREALADPAARRLLIEKFPGIEERLAEVFGKAS